MYGVMLNTQIDELARRIAGSRLVSQVGYKFLHGFEQPSTRFFTNLSKMCIAQPRYKLASERGCAIAPLPPPCELAQSTCSLHNKSSSTEDEHILSDAARRIREPYWTKRFPLAVLPELDVGFPVFCSGGFPSVTEK